MSAKQGVILYHVAALVVSPITRSEPPEQMIGEEMLSNLTNDTFA